MRFATVAAVFGLAFACSHGSASSSNTAPPSEAQASTGASQGMAGQPPPGAPGQDSSAQPGQGMTQDDAQAAEEVRDHHRHHHHGGVMMFIALSLDTLGSEPQKQDQVRQIQSTLRQQMRPARDAERNVLAALADGVASGQVDNARLSAAVNQEATEAASIHEASLDALNQLHQILSPEERAALLEKVRAHFEVWRQVNADDDEAAPHSHLQHLARALRLSPDQVQRIEGALRSNGSGHRDPTAIERRVQAFETAFSGDSFDARALQANRPDPAQFATPAERMVRFYEAVTPVLTQEQRQTLANRLRDRANDSPQNLSSNGARQ
jgi:Spy/CpxP family protein refolding chaperone